MSPILFQSILVLAGGTVIDGTGAPPQPNAVIEIRDERITRIASADDYDAPASARVIDVSGMWLLPGLIDTHTHLFDSGSLYTSPNGG